MKAIAMFLAALAIATAAAASDTARVDGRLVTTGMSVAEVNDRIGAPTRVEDITNVYGARIGARWEYHRGRKMVTLWVQTGKVVRIDEQ